MDYEKFYKDALERAKELLEEAKVFEYEDGQIAHDIRTTIYGIFPELKESEDERIRKELIDFVKSRLAGFPDCKRFTTWLEKQCEQEEPQVYKTEDDEIITYSETDGYKAAEPIRSEEDDAAKAAEEYRRYRESFGIKDPVMLNEIEEAYYQGAIRRKPQRMVSAEAKEP